MNAKIKKMMKTLLVYPIAAVGQSDGDAVGLLTIPEPSGELGSNSEVTEMIGHGNYFILVAFVILFLIGTFLTARYFQENDYKGGIGPALSIPVAIILLAISGWVIGST